MDNMRFYEAGRSVPQEAQRPFDNGRFSGTDINPMWRIKKLTELFGPAGLGWYYEVLSERAEAAGDVVMAIVDLNLYIKDPESGEWSKPIYGTGGNVLLRKGSASDEGYKMALTDALSVACKALGIGADIYFGADATKYTQPPAQPAQPVQPVQPVRPMQTGRPAQPMQNGRPAQPMQTGRPVQPMQGYRSQPISRCSACGVEIDDRVRVYATERFGRPLCRACQGRANTQIP